MSVITSTAKGGSTKDQPHRMKTASDTSSHQQQQQPQQQQEEADWHGKDMVQSNYHMLRNQIACDVDFIVQSGEAKTTIPAHSFMLISRSQVFEAMLTTDFKEKDSRTVEIVDISPKDFSDLLVFMYTERTKITAHNVQQLQYAANKYLIGGLAKQCRTFLENNITIENACVILDNSLLYADDVSAQRCLNFIANKATDVLRTCAFNKMSSKSLKSILSMDSLNIRREDSVLRATIRWAHEQLKPDQMETITDEIVRETLGDCLYQIRFGDLDPATLTQTVGLSGLLTDREFRLFGNYSHKLSGKEVKRDLEKLGFNLKPRQNCLNTRQSHQQYEPTGQIVRSGRLTLIDPSGKSTHR